MKRWINLNKKCTLRRWITLNQNCTLRRWINLNQKCTLRRWINWNKKCTLRRWVNWNQEHTWKRWINQSIVYLKFLFWFYGWTIFAMTRFMLWPIEMWNVENTDRLCQFLIYCIFMYNINYNIQYEWHSYSVMLTFALSLFALFSNLPTAFTTQNKQITKYIFDPCTNIYISIHTNVL